MSDILWLSEPAERGHLDNGVLDLLCQVLGQRGGDVARRDRIDCYLARAKLFGQGIGKANDARFGRRVVSLADLSRKPRDGADVDDTSAFPCSQHGADGGFAAVIDAFQVGIQNHVPVLFFHLHQEHVAGGASVVDQDINRAKGADGSFDQFLGLTKVRDVGSNGSGLPTFCLDGCYHPIPRLAPVTRATLVSNDFILLSHN